MNNRTPLVSVITPVYNGESYLSECIESVLNQSYQNWEYVIVNNASTDATGDIISHYAELDARIRVHTNDRTVDVIHNHNIAFGLISSDSAYCKLVQADDWMFPECMERMIQVAESAPSVGVVGSYCLAGKWIRCDGVPYPGTVIPGTDLCRRSLRGEIYLFWSPSCLMIRSGLVRNRQPFYRSAYLNADVDALYEILQDHDFGFVHQVLTYIRVHEKSMTSQDAKRLNTQRMSHLHLISKYGPIYLQREEFESRLEKLLKDYYQSLALGVFDLRKREFWQFQKSEMRKLGYPLNLINLIFAVFSEIVSNPRKTGRRLKTAILEKQG